MAVSYLPPEFVFTHTKLLAQSSRFYNLSKNPLLRCEDVLNRPNYVWDFESLSSNYFLYTYHGNIYNQKQISRKIIKYLDEELNFPLDIAKLVTDFVVDFWI